MLVLSRRANQSLVIPECETTIKVSRISGQRVYLAVDAPRRVDVFRDEVWRRMSRIALEADDAAPSHARHNALEVLWLDAGVDGSIATDDASVQGANESIRFTMVNSAAACIGRLLCERPDLLILDVDAVTGRAEGLLNFLSRDERLCRTPVLLLFSGQDADALLDDYPQVVDRLRKPIRALDLRRGVELLFAYRAWREAYHQVRIEDRHEQLCTPVSRRRASVSAEGASMAQAV